MNYGKLINNAEKYLSVLSGVKPNRRTGSKGNRKAVDFFARTLSRMEYQIDTTPFDCLDYIPGKASLSSGREIFKIYSSPYSPGCNLASGAVIASNTGELESLTCRDRILLLKDEICAEQLMPKNFVFYNPEHHKKIYSLLEEKRPAAVITATSKNPNAVGALYPYPLIVDGDFNIPTAYCTDTVGEKIAERAVEGEIFSLQLQGKRIPSTGSNVIARKNPSAEKKVVLTAHIDAYEDSPGASDNASGTVVLLLLAELLAGYEGPLGIEFAAINGEDHYSAAGEMDYLKRYGSELDKILTVINIDDVGFVRGGTAYSLYECSGQIQEAAEEVFKKCDGITAGEQWFSGDHMVFVQRGVPAIAFTAELLPELMRTVTHTSQDTPDIVDCSKLVKLAYALEKMVYRLS